jgi:hypothetical protein
VTPIAPPSVGLPVRVGQAVALMLHAGDAVVGLVANIDENFVEITAIDWLTQRFDGETAAFRIEGVDRIAWAGCHRDGDAWIFDTGTLWDAMRAWTDSHSTRNSL